MAENAIRSHCAVFQIRCGAEIKKDRRLLLGEFGRRSGENYNSAAGAFRNILFCGVSITADNALPIQKIAAAGANVETVLFIPGNATQIFKAINFAVLADGGVSEFLLPVFFLTADTVFISAVTVKNIHDRFGFRTVFLLNLTGKNIKRLIFADFQ